MKKEYIDAYSKFLNNSNFKAAIFKDGIVNEDVFGTNEFRPLFIMREVNDKENHQEIEVTSLFGEGSDLLNGIHKTWQQVASLIYFFKQIYGDDNTTINYENIFNSTREENQQPTSCYREAVNSVAIINLKKVGGGGHITSVASKKTAYYEEHAANFSEELKAQITEINPNIIICCGAGTKKVCDKHKLLSELPKNCFITEVYHPSWWAKKKMQENYNKALEDYRTHLKQKKSDQP